jgi:hypothetical protein
MVHICNLSYWGGGNWKDHSFRPAWAKPVSETAPISPNKVVMIVHACNPSYMGGISRITAVRSWPWAKSMTP